MRVVIPPPDLSLEDYKILEFLSLNGKSNANRILQSSKVLKKHHYSFIVDRIRKLEEESLIERIVSGKDAISLQITWKGLQELRRFQNAWITEFFADPSKPNSIQDRTLMGVVINSDGLVKSVSSTVQAGSTTVQVKTGSILGENLLSEYG